jgi:hypothetical protein
MKGKRVANKPARVTMTIRIDTRTDDALKYFEKILGVGRTALVEGILLPSSDFFESLKVITEDSPGNFQGINLKRQLQNQDEFIKQCHRSLSEEIEIKLGGKVVKISLWHQWEAICDGIEVPNEDMDGNEYIESWPYDHECLDSCVFWGKVVRAKRGDEYYSFQQINENVYIVVGPDDTIKDLKILKEHILKNLKKK